MNLKMNGWISCPLMTRKPVTFLKKIIMGRKKKYKTDEERKAAQKAQHAKHYQQNRDKIRAQQNEYNSTPYGRAIQLLTNYRLSDKLKKRGECTLTAEWIVEHIFSQPCAHCGCSDWRKIGCNRLDNNLPHTPDNVEPCCKKCNDELNNPKKRVYQYTLDGLLVAIWPSTSECSRNGYDNGAITKCCNGKRKTHMGYRWSYENF